MPDVPVPLLHLDLLQTLTLATVVFYAGVLLRQRVPVLDRLNIPSAVVGGLLFAALVFLLFSIAVCLAQNFVGMAVATALGEAPLMGVLAGSVTLVGGPATGLAFAPQFAAAGVDLSLIHI